MSSTTQFPRLPYTGSCHCGHVKYIIYLSLPTLPYPKTTQTKYREASGHRIYRCNCTSCQKSGIIHIRPVDAANDMYVISPKDPMAEGSGFKRYIPEGCEGSWHFCEHCGTRTFAARADGYADYPALQKLGYTEEVELPTALLQRLHSRTLDGTTGPITAKEGETTRVSVWRPRKDWKERGDEDDDAGNGGMSINALSIDAHNENWDLRQLYDQGYMAYMQTLQWVGNDYQDTPYFGGTY